VSTHSIASNASPTSFFSILLTFSPAARVGRLLFGYAMPAFECFKTVEARPNDAHMLRFWCQYWLVRPPPISCRLPIHPPDSSRVRPPQLPFRIIPTSRPRCAARIGYRGFHFP
jgi:hypothetical protein